MCDSVRSGLTERGFLKGAHKLPRATTSGQIRVRQLPLSAFQGVAYGQLYMLCVLLFSNMYRIVITHRYVSIMNMHLIIVSPPTWTAISEPPKTHQPAALLATGGATHQANPSAKWTDKRYRRGDEARLCWLEWHAHLLLCGEPTPSGQPALLRR